MSAARRAALPLAAIAALALALALGAPAAGAAKKKNKPGPIRVATATVSTTADNQVVTATATCPSKTSVVGGGFFGGTSNEGGPLTDANLINVSRRSGGRSWSVTAERLDGGAAGPSLPLTSEAYCRAKAGKISEAAATSSITLAGGFPFTAAAPCKLGLTALAGGVSYTATPGGLNHLLFRLGPFGVVGFTGVALPTAAGPHSLSTYAYCGKPSKSPKTRTAVASLSTTAGASVSATTPSCPAKLASFGGGFASTSFQPDAAIPLVFESRRSGNGWRASAINLGVPDPGQLTATAVCS